MRRFATRLTRTPAVSVCGTNGGASMFFRDHLRRCWASHVFWICILSASMAACMTQYLLIRFR